MTLRVVGIGWATIFHFLGRVVPGVWSSSEQQTTSALTRNVTRFKPGFWEAAAKGGGKPEQRRGRPLRPP